MCAWAVALGIVVAVVTNERSCARDRRTLPRRRVIREPISSRIVLHFGGACPILRMVFRAGRNPAAPARSHNFLGWPVYYDETSLEVWHSFLTERAADRVKW